MPAGYLYVFSEPGKEVPLDEFQDWYNNEHVPLRQRLPQFLTAARFQASDGQIPGWLAMYDVDDTSTFQQEVYTSLRTHRSPREHALVARLEELDRRTCEVIYSSDEDLSGLKVASATTGVVTYSLDVESDEAMLEKVREQVAKLKDVKGWTRVKVIRVLDNLKSGLKYKDAGEDAQVVPRYAIIHQIQDSEAAGEIKKLVGQVKEWREWKLYRAYPTISQGYVAA